MNKQVITALVKELIQIRYWSHEINPRILDSSCLHDDHIISDFLSWISYLQLLRDISKILTMPLRKELYVVYSIPDWYLRLTLGELVDNIYKQLP